MGSKGDQWSNSPPRRALQISSLRKEARIKTDLELTQSENHHPGLQTDQRAGRSTGLTNNMHFIKILVYLENLATQTAGPQE